ncbi:hypothetical protein M3664_04375 [Paenibacillus lautus]|uniref:hypothetical protein n=1 Tax=Paenibacillus lautus TaxID=1401 RepID=UPI00204087F9|nr:hypothetical protein [Paenibacillus lautus]MCM3257016.1 hypothetical protein [Paenibacillus lautus]
MSIRNLLSGIDSYILENYHTLTCEQLANLYLEFIESLRVNNLNTNNLTGLTEIIFSRAFYFYNKKAIDEGKITIVNNANLAGQQPDLVIYASGLPVASVEIKSNYSNILQDCERHQQVYKHHHDINLLTIAFEVKQKSNMNKLNAILNEDAIYRVLVLNQSQELFKDELKRINLIF